MMDLFIAPNGNVTTIYSEEIDLTTIGPPVISRASHVEPDCNGQWYAQMVDGPRLGPFSKRSEALRAEADWLIKHRLLKSR